MWVTILPPPPSFPPPQAEVLFFYVFISWNKTTSWLKENNALSVSSAPPFTAHTYMHTTLVHILWWLSWFYCSTMNFNVNERQNVNVSEWETPNYSACCQYKTSKISHCVISHTTQNSFHFWNEFRTLRNRQIVKSEHTECCAVNNVLYLMWCKFTPSDRMTLTEHIHYTRYHNTVILSSIYCSKIRPWIF